MSQKIKLTEKYSITLGAAKRVHYLKAMQEDTASRYENLRPKPVQGYTHELAYEKVDSYREEWDKYARELLNSWVYLMYGVAWQVGTLDMDEGEYQAELAAASMLGRRLGLPTPKADDLVEMGALAYALIEMLAGHEVRDEVSARLNKEAGFLDTAAVAAERKSPAGDGEQPPAGGSERGDKKARKGRG